MRGTYQLATFAPCSTRNRVTSRWSLDDARRGGVDLPQSWAATLALCLSRNRAISRWTRRTSHGAMSTYDGSDLARWHRAWRGTVRYWDGRSEMPPWAVCTHPGPGFQRWCRTRGATRYRDNIWRIPDEVREWEHIVVSGAWGWVVGTWDAGRTSERGVRLVRVRMWADEAGDAGSGAPSVRHRCAFMLEEPNGGKDVEGRERKRREGQ